MLVSRGAPPLFLDLPQAKSTRGQRGRKGRNEKEKGGLKRAGARKGAQTTVEGQARDYDDPGATFAR